jgi:hypothetical protein
MKHSGKIHPVIFKKFNLINDLRQISFSLERTGLQSHVLLGLWSTWLVWAWL